MADETRPALVQPRHGIVLDAVRNAGGSFDIDMLHVMDERDNRLIEDEIMHGAGSTKFVYDFEISGKQVSGISVIGARQLGYHYGGLKHRLVASVEKIGSIFTFTSYPAEGVPMAVTTSRLMDLDGEDDFFSAIVEVADIKTGNTVQMERRETREERRRDGSRFERPHYRTIAQSKAYRNAVLSLVPQDVQIKWKIEMLRLDKNKDLITDSVIDMKRDAVLNFAGKHRVPLNRHQVEQLTFAQISTLRDAIETGGTAGFGAALQAMGIVEAPADGGTAPPVQQITSGDQSTAQTRGRGGRTKGAATKPDEPPPHPGEQGGDIRTPPPGAAQAPTQQVDPKPEPVTQPAAAAAPAATGKPLFG